MFRATLFGTAVLLTLTGCARISDSPINPLNWFGNSRNIAEAAPQDIRPLTPQNRRVQIVDGRALVQSVTSLSVDRSPTGAVVHAAGIAPSQGYFNAQLVNAGVSGDVLTLEFRAQAPTGPQPIGTAQSRQISAAYTIDLATVSAVRTIRVQAATNARTSGR